MGKLTISLAVLMLVFLGAMPSASAYYSTSSERCSTVDLRDEFPLKMRNQGDISWCYAHAASDYLQFQFRTSEQISAADVAIRYNRHFWPRMLRFLNGRAVPQTGFIRTALRDAVADGYCPESVFPSETWTRVDFNGATTEVKLEVATAELLSLQKNIQRGFYLNASELPFHYSFKEVSKEVLFDILRNTSRSKMLNELRVTACEKSRKPFQGSIADVGMRLRGRNVFNRMNAMLDVKQALSVDFFYGLLKNADRFKKSLGELHTTLLYGRRFNDASGECQYMIKNSYGTDCAEYDPQHTCEAGYVWVNESTLYRGMTSYVYFKAKSFDDTASDGFKLSAADDSQIQSDLDGESSEDALEGSLLSELN